MNNNNEVKINDIYRVLNFQAIVFLLLLSFGGEMNFAINWQHQE